MAGIMFFKIFLSIILFAIASQLAVIMYMLGSISMVPDQISIEHRDKTGTFDPNDVDPQEVEECRQINREIREETSSDESSSEDQTIHEALGIENES